MVSYAVNGCSFWGVCALEYLFWLTPIKQVMDRLSPRGTAFYIFPVHYWIRILIAFAVVLGFKPTFHYPFGGLITLVYSLLLGVVICPRVFGLVQIQLVVQGQRPREFPSAFCFT